ncbi:hypothetical protein N9F34_01225 [Alphaproteobacteria bacterium]|nr:hypothetical protein [Alphaproteobacteria bacterium]
MRTRDAIDDPILRRIYKGESRLHARDLSQDWLVGLLIHLQRSNSRPFKAEMAAILAQHTRWMTQEFDEEDRTLDEEGEARFAELAQDGYTYLQLPEKFVETIEASFHDVILDDNTSEHQIIYGEDVRAAPKTSYSSNFKNPALCILEFPEVVKLVCNRFIMRLVYRHLGALPRLSGMALTVSQSGKDGSVSSADWHIDKGPLSWLKMFIYLNDVDSNSGPHAFVRGSQNDVFVHEALRASLPRQSEYVGTLMGAQRWTDSHVRAVFPDRKKYHVGPKGTAFLEDTRGFHKATHPTKGIRRMLTIEWSLDPSPYGPPPRRIGFDALAKSIRPTNPKSEARFRYMFGQYLQ